MVKTQGGQGPGAQDRRTRAPRRGRPGHDLGAVIEAGIALFNERGYDGTTVDDLAATLGIAKSSVYHHVSGKEEILARALDRALGALEAAVDDVAAAQGSSLQLLKDTVRAAVRTLVAELPSVTLLLRVRGNSAVERAALARRRALDARFAGLVREAMNDGFLRADLDPAFVARLVFGTVNSLVEWYRPRPAGADQAAVVADAVCSVVFDGLRAPPTLGRPDRLPAPGGTRAYAPK